jgi:hypothetical protein
VPELDQRVFREQLRAAFRFAEYAGPDGDVLCDEIWAVPPTCLGALAARRIHGSDDKPGGV